MSEPFEPLEATISQMRAGMSSGHLTSRRLVELHLERVAAYDRSGPAINAVLELNPDALEFAGALDRERAQGSTRGPLHGVPVLLKDNIDTADRLHTSAGSLALADSVAPRDAPLVERLRSAGAVVLGKANMTEWANFMALGMPAGYSSRGGQVKNPHLEGLHPGGSSSGSASAVAASLCAVAVGTETSGSILSPANQNAIVGIKPTVGLVSRAGVVPIASSQDTPGPLARTVEDAALLLAAIQGHDPADPATRPLRGREPTDYAGSLDPDGLRGARIGVPRDHYFDRERLPADQARLAEEALTALRELGAEVVDPADVPTARAAAGLRFDVLLYEFRRDLNRYLRGLGPGAPVRSLRDLIRYNEARPTEMLRYGQALLLASQATGGTGTARVPTREGRGPTALPDGGAGRGPGRAPAGRAGVSGDWGGWDWGEGGLPERGRAGGVHGGGATVRADLPGAGLERGEPHPIRPRLRTSDAAPEATRGHAGAVPDLSDEGKNEEFRQATVPARGGGRGAAQEKLWIRS
jgi:amidase